MTLKKNKIHQGDCVKLLAKVPSGSVDLVFADPPFNIGYEYDVYDDDQSETDYLSWCSQWIQGVHDALKPDGTFWLAIGDEYAAELKIESQKAGFHCRSWVIWYYTFGVNCLNGFSRSHTHLFHFVKDKKKFTFNRPNPQIRVKSARQLVYADNRANPSGRLPDNTWITRPQDAPESFSPNHDTWYFARVAGTFKEREGFHGCQMPEQLLARIILSSSNPHDLVLDPFGGSGTTLCVAKKLNRHWMGFELSEEYATHIHQRLEDTQVGSPIDGPSDPIESAPATINGKQRVIKDFDDKTIGAVIDAFNDSSDGFPAYYVVCYKKLDKAFLSACRKHGLKGNPTVWNRLLLKLASDDKLPQPTQTVADVTDAELNEYGFASEVAWRLVSDDFSSQSNPISLDQILCCPESAMYFDQIAMKYGPQDNQPTSLQYRLAALAIRESANVDQAAMKKLENWSLDSLNTVATTELNDTKLDRAGVFLLTSNEVAIYVGEADDLAQQISHILANEAWTDLEVDQIHWIARSKNATNGRNLKSIVVQHTNPLLNSRVWIPQKPTKKQQAMFASSF